MRHGRLRLIKPVNLEAEDSVAEEHVVPMLQIVHQGQVVVGEGFNINEISKVSSCISIAMHPVSISVSVLTPITC